jgi:transposase InsO family protein
MGTLSGPATARVLRRQRHVFSDARVERLGSISVGNGSEYVNHAVARLLEKLRIEFTRSRPRRSNDNGLAETKNGAVVRKLFGYEHIPQRHASRFNTFCVEYLNPFLNSIGRACSPPRWPMRRSLGSRHTSLDKTPSCKNPGEMAEWSNAPNSKSGVRYPRTEDSNPSLSANTTHEAGPSRPVPPSATAAQFCPE